MNQMKGLLSSFYVTLMEKRRDKQGGHLFSRDTVYLEGH